MNPNSDPSKDVMRAGVVFMNIGKKAKEREWYETALHVFNIAEKVTEDPKDLMKICIEKSIVHKALANIDGTREEASKAMSLNKYVGSILPYLNMADVLYNEDDYEESVVKLINGMGKSQNPAFYKGINMAMGTLLNTVGENAGAMFDREVLGNIVERIKQEQLGLAPPTKKLTYLGKIERDLSLKQRKKYLARRYLGQLAVHKEFLEEIKNLKSLKQGSKNVVEKVQSIIDNTLTRLEAKQDTLWHRKPLYSFYSKVRQFQTSDYSKKFEVHKRQLDKTTLDLSIINKLEELWNLKEKGQNFDCYNKMLRLRNQMKYISEKKLPNKLDYTIYMLNIIGDMYLLTKKILPNCSQEINDLRIKNYLGIYKPHWPVKIGEVNHVEINNCKQLKVGFIKELKKTKNYLEKAFLNHEIACLIGINPVGNTDMKIYCVNTIAAAKKSKNPTWLLNGLFSLARAELKTGNLMEGKHLLVTAKEACKTYKKLECAEFADRALLLLEYIKPSHYEIKESVGAKQKEMIDIMPDELKDATAAFFNTLNDVPEWRRLGIFGSLTKKQRAEELKILRPFPVEKFCEDSIMATEENWVAGLDDTEPYFVKDLRTSEDESKLLTTVRNTPRFLQYLTLQSVTVRTGS